MEQINLDFVVWKEKLAFSYKTSEMVRYLIREEGRVCAKCIPVMIDCHLTSSGNPRFVYRTTGIDCHDDPHVKLEYLAWSFHDVSELVIAQSPS